MKVHPIVYFLFKFLIRLVLVLVFIGLPAAVYYQRVHGIGFGAKEALSQALSTPTLEVGIGRLALDPFRGLVANDVRLRERGNHERTLATINQVAISLNFGELMRRRVVVDSLLLRQAGASIPVSKDTNADRVDMENINAEIILLGDSLRLSSFEATVEGISIRLSGEVRNPLAFHFSPQERPTDPSLRNQALEHFLTILSETSFPHGKIMLDANFEIDAAAPDTLEVPGFSITCPQIKHKSLSISDIKVQGAYMDGNLRIPIIQFKDANGTLLGSGEWDRGNSKAKLSLRSNLQPSPLLETFFGKDKKNAFPLFASPPQLEADLSADFTQPKAGLKIIGNFLAPDISYKGVTFRDVGFGFAWADERLYLRDISLRGKRGAFAGNIWVAPGDFRAQLHLTIPPPDLSPLFDPQAREFLDKMEMEDLPEISLSLRAPKLDFGMIKGTGHLKLGRTSMRGAWIDSGVADLQIADSCVSYRNIVITTGPGKGTGAFDYDVGKQEVRLEKIRSTLMPYDVLMWIDPKIAKTISPYRFRSNPSVSVQGKVHMRTATKNNLSIQVESPAGMDYDLLGKTLSFGKTSAKVLIVGNKVDARVTRAPIMGGDVTVKADVSIDPQSPFFSADVQLQRVNFSQLTKLYFNYDDSKGVISGKYNFETQMGQEELMKGKGNIRIEDGNVFAIPTLGPFSSIIGGILPGVAYNSARLATADFTVANKKITTKNIEIVGSGFTMFGSGDIYFLTGHLDMDMRLNAQGVPGIVFFPMSKLLEYHSDGTISSPGWSPKIIPRIPVFGGAKKTGERTP